MYRFEYGQVGTLARPALGNRPFRPRRVVCGKDNNRQSDLVSFIRLR